MQGKARACTTAEVAVWAQERGEAVAAWPSSAAAASAVTSAAVAVAAAAASPAGARSVEGTALDAETEGQGTVVAAARTRPR